MFPITIRDGVELRLLSPPDAPALWAVVCANREHLGIWLDLPHVLDSEELTHDWLVQCQAGYHRGRTLICGIWRGTELRGCIALMDIHPQKYHATLGYWIAEAYEGQGLVSAACQQTLRHAFEELQLQKVEIHVPQGNDRSQRVAERLGFVAEGIRRQYYWVNHWPHDLMLYGLLVTEWRRQQAAE